MPVESVLMEIFVWWEAPVSMKVEWRCASMTSGGQCVMMTGAELMPVWSASSWVNATTGSECKYCVFSTSKSVF